MSRALDVWLEDDRAGRLHENNGIWSFDYDTCRSQTCSGNCQSSE